MDAQPPRTSRAATANDAISQEKARPEPGECGATSSPARRKLKCKSPPLSSPNLSPALQGFGGVIGEARALAAHERDVTAVGPAFHAVDYVGEAGAAFGEV